MIAYNFPANYDLILERVNKVNPIKYAQSRNFLDGSVTYLSPYISRGVISTKQVWEIAQSNGFTISQSEKFIQELAWREYFQRAWQILEDDIFDDIRHNYTGINHARMPLVVANAVTGINAIDDALKKLFRTGYIHNHLRMYTASIVCNIGKAHWQLPSQWMYYHLLDGDLASNTCSWQWVAGTFSSKKYYCNQENINRYTLTNQQNTFLNCSYEDLQKMDIPDPLKETINISFETKLPGSKIPELDSTLPLLIYNSYNLDPLWRKDIRANRILLLEPSHYNSHPVSEKVIDFILQLGKNIDGIQLFVGEVNEIPYINQFPAIYSKENPAFKHYPGTKDERDWLFPEVKGFYNSFYSFWKKCEKYLKKEKFHLQGLIRA
ncbi:MAG TPA: FAD-binding domain-containing protein [Chitinophagaceae bacterium]|nr:FAD-binding domain-containing protein [Chitinophagaceae bacterium]